MLNRWYTDSITWSDGISMKF